VNSLNRLSEDWPLVERHSRAPHNTLWHELFRYSGKEKSEALFRNAQPDSNPISNFRNALLLADDMVIAWEDIDDDFTGAILLYYGALWLGQAVALATLDSATIENRDALHGFTATYSMNGSTPFLSAKVNFGKSTSSAGTVNRAFGGEDLNGRACEVADLLCALPEMRPGLPHVDLESEAIPVVHDDEYELEGLVSTNPTIGVSLPLDRSISDGWLRDSIAVAPYLSAHEVTIIQSAPDLGYIRWRRAPEDRGFISEMRALCVETGAQRFFFPKIKQRAVSEYAVYLGILYVVADLARYHPDYWMTMQRNRTGEYFIIREFLDVAEEKVPNLALNHLSRETYVFRSA
jgi:hypothetical protein